MAMIPRSCMSVGPATLLLAASTVGAGTLNFSDVTTHKVVSTTTETANNEKAVDFGDFDQDGDLDVLIGNAYSDFGARRNKLYRNDGGVMQEVTGAPIIPGFDVEHVTRAAFLRDYTGDGWLDIAVINDQNSNANDLLINVHPGGVFDHFEDVGQSRYPAGGLGGTADSAVSLDIDGMGGIDLIISSGPNSPQNRIWLNDGAGFFSDATASLMPAYNDYSVDIASGDLNGDGQVDLILSNQDQFNRVYYNNLPGTSSSGLGDFQYSPSGVQNLLDGVANENSMEAGDFNGDGLADIYWSGGPGGTSADRVYQNMGNDASGKAVFQLLPYELLPASVMDIVSRKPTVADLNDDGRLDVFVPKEGSTDSRPTILRNVSVNGVIQFIDWTPGKAFPAGNTHKGWHAAVLDTDGDGDKDIFLGGWAGDHLFENTPPLTFVEADLEGQIFPPLFNNYAAVVTGTAAFGETDAYHTSDEQPGFLSVVLTGPDDYRLELQTTDHVVIGESNRGGIGVEEALQVDVTGATKIVVQVLACAASPGDTNGDCAVGITDLLDLLAAWGPNPGNPADLDGDGIVGIGDFLDMLALWGPISHEYQIELLTRD